MLAEKGSAKAIGPLSESLADNGWTERAAAAVALGKLGNGRGVDALTTALAGDDDVDVRCSAAWALGKIGGKGALEPLAASLGDADASVRRVAAEALARVGTAGALEGLCRALEDEHHDVRLAGAKGLGKIGSGKTAEHLLRALDDPEWSVRTAAAESLAKLENSGAVPALLAALTSGSPAARLAAAEALGRIGDPRALDGLVAALRPDGDMPTGLQGADLRLRRNVAKALGEIGKAGAVEPLLTLSGDGYTAGAAVESLAKVLRWDAGDVDDGTLARLSELDGCTQIPWMIDEVEEAASGRVFIREGKAWPVDGSDVQALARAELDRRARVSGGGQAS